MTTIRFNIATDDYRVFIQKIRDWAKDPHRFSHQRPVLPYPPQNMHQAEYADLELKGKDSANVERTLIARIRRHDLYIIGYKMHGAPNFLEFKWDDKGTKYIQNSTSLGFGENYSNLGNLEDLPKVGYTTLKDAITLLATTKDKTHDEIETRKHSLRALAVMIPEVTRFEKMMEVVVDPMKDKKDTKFDSWMATLIHSWTPLSDMLLREDQFAIYFKLTKNKDGSLNKLSTYPELKIITAAQAAQCLAILKGNYHEAKQKSIAINAISNAVQGKGLALVEIFCVRVTNIAGKNPGSLFGRVDFLDGLGSFSVYDLQRDSSESIRPNDIATLTGPYRAFSGSQLFQVNLDLKNKGSNPTQDNEVSKGSFAWDICEITNNDYFNKRLTQVINGKNGSVTAYYTPFRDAIQARVEVVLVQGGGQNSVDVQGSLTSQYSNFDYSTDEQKKYYRTSLFSKTSRVNVGSKIPLSRTVVAVPTTGSLVIEANMETTNKLEIAKGTVQFSPQLSGDDTKEITGKNGRIRVKVTWSAQISEQVNATVKSPSLNDN